MLYSEIIEARFPRKPSDETLLSVGQAGFDSSKLWYHGTRRRFDGFRLPKTEGIDELGPGVYVTSKKWLANTWARDGGFILTCVVKEGPLFDFDKIRNEFRTITNPALRAMLKDGYIKKQKMLWPDDKTEITDDLFDDIWTSTRDRRGLLNSCLSAYGYIGGFKQDSQIEGQIVVFKPDDVMIVARERGRNYMTSFE